MSGLDLYSMFLLGFLGTGHCIGMCGPLVIAFPAGHDRFAAHLFYHLGRIGTYTVVGGIMGGLGAGILKTATLSGGDPLVWVARLQVGISGLAALFLVGFGLFRIGLISEPSWMSSAFPERIPVLHRAIRSAAEMTGLHGMFFLGLFLGLLPCGLSFAAFARVLPTGSVSEAALLVFAFGIGTVPGLMFVGTGATALARRYRKHSDILSGILMLAMGASLGADIIGLLG
jgi:uncharacterized protein